MKVIIKSCLIHTTLPEGTMKNEDRLIDKCFELTYHYDGYVNQPNQIPMNNFMDTSFDVDQNAYISGPCLVTPQHILPNPYLFHHVYVAHYYSHLSFHNHSVGYPRV